MYTEYQVFDLTEIRLIYLIEVANVTFQKVSEDNLY